MFEVSHYVCTAGVEVSFYSVWEAQTEFRGSRVSVRLGLNFTRERRDFLLCALSRGLSRTDIRTEKTHYM